MAKPTSPKQKAAKAPGSPAPVKSVPEPSPASRPAMPDRPRSHFLRDLSIVTVLGTAGLAAYYKHNQTVTTVNHVDKKAKDLIEKDTPQDFYEAEKQLKKALDLDSSNAYSLSALAEMDALLWGEDGVEDRKGAAQELAKKADEIRDEEGAAWAEARSSSIRSVAPSTPNPAAYNWASCRRSR